jgi:signal peptidase
MGIQKKVKLIGKIIFYIIFGAVLLLVIGMFISKISNRVFFLGDRATIWVMTDSMEEAIPEQSYIRIRKVDPSEIKVGDVITFYSDDPALKGNLNTHRVVELAEDGRSFVTKGDHNVAVDKYPAKADAVVGVYEKNLSVMTVIGRFLQSKIALLCILVLLAALTVYSFAGDSLKKKLPKNTKDSSSDEPDEKL